jgi:hypothetical protein
VKPRKKRRNRSTILRKYEWMAVAAVVTLLSMPASARNTFYSLRAPSRTIAPEYQDSQSRSEVCAQVKPLVDLMAAHGRPLPGAVRQRLVRAAERGQATQVDAILNSWCLLEIHINPESRVKVTRGPARAELRQRDKSVFLLRVTNEAGVTAPLRVSGPNLVAGPSDGKASKRNRWLSAAVVTAHAARLDPLLSGSGVEYVLLALTTKEAGQREATLAFDVGQGTQDLGFRGEISLLFQCRPSKRRILPASGIGFGVQPILCRFMA